MATKKHTESVKVRVLLDCNYGKADDVIELTPEQLKEALGAGWVDANPAAVAYAETLKG